jgi:hypothetical protein
MRAIRAVRDVKQNITDMVDFVKSDFPKFIPAISIDVRPNFMVR